MKWSKRDLVPQRRSDRSDKIQTFRKFSIDLLKFLNNSFKNSETFRCFKVKCWDSETVGVGKYISL